MASDPILPTPASTAQSRHRSLRAHGRSLRAYGLVACLVVILGAVAATVFTSRDATPPAVRLLAEDEGRVREWILFLCDEYASMFVPTQADLVSKTDAKIRFRIVYGEERSRQGLARALAVRHVDPARVTWVKNVGGVPPWARDYFLAAATADGTSAYLLHDAAHYGRLRYGRRATSASTLAAVRSLAGGHPRSTSVGVDGGAVVAARDRAFVNEDALLRALAERAFADEAGFRAHLQATWGLPVEILRTGGLDAAHHCDLYLMPAGPKRVVLGSPRLAIELLESAGREGRARFQKQVRSMASMASRNDAVRLLGRIDVAARLRQENSAPNRLRAFASIKRRLEVLGYECVEVPLLLLDGQRNGAEFTLSYTNVVQDHRGGKPTVYLPTYRFDVLDNAAARAWRRLGYEVVRIDALGPALNGGGVHCLSQVLRAR